MILAQFRAGGRPRTKGSLRPICTRDRRHTVHLEEEVEESKFWRKVVARACREHQLATNGKFLQYIGPVEVRLVFFFPRTEAKRAGAGTGMPIPTHATEWPIHITLGDADKLARNVLDALSTPKRRQDAPLTSALLADDSQVVKLSVAKFWSTADNWPGVQVLVMDVVEPELELLASMDLQNMAAHRQTSDATPNSSEVGRG
jgi:Holliday junction resolvase RusA-like endonuclease